MKSWVKLLTFCTVAVLGLAACHDTDPIPEIPGLVVTDNRDRAIINDSFEREEIFENPDVQTLFGWRGFIWDFGTPVLGLDGDQVDAVIFNNTEVAPAADGENALYFFGRPGNSVHNLYLISQRYDLSDFNTAILSFNYLTFMLNDAEDQVDGVEEFLKVEVCNATINECGVNEDFLDTNGLNNESVWTTVFDHRDASPDLDGLGFDGQNHTASDWRLGQILVDLRDQSIIQDKANVVFRFTARMRDGMTPDEMCPDDDDDSSSDDYEKKHRKIKKLKKKKKRLKRWFHKLEDKLESVERDCRGKHCDFKIDHLKSKIKGLRKAIKKIKKKIIELKEHKAGDDNQQCDANMDSAIRFVDGAAIDNVNALGSPLTVEELF